MKCIVLLGLLGLSVAGCQKAPAPAAANATPTFYVSMAQPGAVVDAVSARDMISVYRRNNGLGPLSIDPALQALAQDQAKMMAAAGAPASAEAVKALVGREGYPSPAANVSAGYHTVAEAFSGWRESAQHNKVLLDPKASRLGIATAYVPNSKYKVYWVLVMAGVRG
jgi:uncharacterized protein YkwD